MQNRKAMVIFPGKNYGDDCPLLYYARIAFKSHGYETAAVQYTSETKAESLQAFIHDNRQSVKAQLLALHLSMVDDIVFVSKSLGTVFAGWAEDVLGVRVRHILMTPIRETLPYIHQGKQIAGVVGGIADPVLDAEMLKTHCTKEGVHLVQFNGADHRLEVAEDTEKSIDILRAVAAIYIECANWPTARLH